MKTKVALLVAMLRAASCERGDEEMKFRHQDADIFGTSEWELLNDNGQETGVSIADLRSEAFGFVVLYGGDTYGTADTFAEAKRIALDTP